MLFLQQLENSLRVDQVYDIVLISALIPRNLLVRRISPIAVNSELIHVLLRFQELDENVCRWLHAYLLC